MFVVLVNFKVKPESVEAFRAKVLQQAANSLKNEEACRQFDVSFDPNDATSCLLYEVYDNEADLAAHRQTTYFEAFNKAIADEVVSKEVSYWNRAQDAAGTAQ